jgi:hypothetical protein
MTLIFLSQEKKIIHSLAHALFDELWYAKGLVRKHALKCNYVRTYLMKHLAGL